MYRVCPISISMWEGAGIIIFIYIIINSLHMFILFFFFQKNKLKLWRLSIWISVIWLEGWGKNLGLLTCSNSTTTQKFPPVYQPPTLLSPLWLPGHHWSWRTDETLSHLSSMPSPIRMQGRGKNLETMRGGAKKIYKRSGALREVWGTGETREGKDMI